MARRAFVTIMLCMLVSTTATTARADVCLKVTESPFADGVCDLFLRLRKKLPANPGGMKSLFGRVNGNSPVYGSAVRRGDVLGSPVEVTLTASDTPGSAYAPICPIVPPCFLDVDLNRVTYPINLWLMVDGDGGEGFCSGPYGGQFAPSEFSVDVSVVSCSLEP